VTNPICWTCKNCSNECAADCEHCVTQPSTEQFWQYSPLTSRQSTAYMSVLPTVNIVSHSPAQSSQSSSDNIPP